MPQENFDSVAMVDAGLGEQEMAEKYLRAVVERTAVALEPARMQAVDKWNQERKQRRQLQDREQAVWCIWVFKVFRVIRVFRV